MEVTPETFDVQFTRSTIFIKLTGEECETIETLSYKRF